METDLYGKNKEMMGENRDLHLSWTTIRGMNKMEMVTFAKYTAWP